MRVSLLSLLAVVLAPCAHAQEVEAVDRIVVELNAAATDQQACTLTFVVTNGFSHAIDELVVETVLFTTAGHVDRLTLFSFGTVPGQRQRVRQFSVDALICEDLGQVLFNGIERCAGGSLTPVSCTAALITGSRGDIEVTN